jgi:hypothetical protein
MYPHGFFTRYIILSSTQIGEAKERALCEAADGN